MHRSWPLPLLLTLAMTAACAPAYGQQAQPLAGVIVSEGTLDTYVGRYALARDSELRVWREGQDLMVQATGQEAWPLLAESESVFHVQALQVKVTFGENAHGDIDHVVLMMDGRERKALRRNLWAQ